MSIAKTGKERFKLALQCKNYDCPPIWFMRQAGRYHEKFQIKRQQHSFVEICKNPQLAAQTALDPIVDFDFDIAILFSDILFSLETIGIAVDFNPGPQLQPYLDNIKIFDQLKPKPVSYLEFQPEAILATRSVIPNDKGLIGFVGGLFTLYAFAVQANNNIDNNIFDDRFKKFMDLMTPNLIKIISMQAQANPEAIIILDSKTGLMPHHIYKHYYLPYLQELINQNYGVPILYYSLGSSVSCLDHIAKLNVSGLGIDYQNNIPDMINRYPNLAIQGNFWQNFLHLPASKCKIHIQQFLNDMKDKNTKGWICGLGHGITPRAKQENVNLFVKELRNYFVK